MPDENGDMLVYADEEGLLHTGNEKTQLTWMDASINGEPVTPRDGCAVELNALWFDALSFADIPILADIYAARETNTYHISSQDIAKKIKSAQYFDSFDKICDFIRKEATKDDLVVVMGAGDIYKVSEMLTEQK